MDRQARRRSAAFEGGSIVPRVDGSVAAAPSRPAGRRTPVRMRVSATPGTSRFYAHLAPGYLRDEVDRLRFAREEEPATEPVPAAASVEKSTPLAAWVLRAPLDSILGAGATSDKPSTLAHLRGAGHGFRNRHQPGAVDHARRRIFCRFREPGPDVTRREGTGGDGKMGNEGATGPRVAAAPFRSAASRPFLTELGGRARRAWAGATLRAECIEASSVSTPRSLLPRLR
jgi:hypothetical protein